MDWKKETIEINGIPIEKATSENKIVYTIHDKKLPKRGWYETHISQISEKRYIVGGVVHSFCGPKKWFSHEFNNLFDATDYALNLLLNMYKEYTLNCP